MHRYMRLCALVATLAATLTGAASAAEQHNDKPWTLRDHYTFPIANAFMRYGVDNTDWSISAEEAGTVIEHAGAEVRLADGTVVDFSTGGHGSTDRQTFTSSLGAGTRYNVRLPERGGFEVNHSVSVHKTRPFFLIHIEIKNVSDKAVDVSEIAPVVIRPGDMPFFQDGADVTRRYLSARGAYPVYDRASAPLLTMFSKADSVSVALGVLPSGNTEPGTVFETFGGQWHGRVRCLFEPPVRLDPGESIEADPVWISFALPKPDDVQLYYAWSHSMMPAHLPSRRLPDAWVTVPRGGSAADLLRAIENWTDLPVKFVLVPGGWESRPGALQGAAPLFPRNLGNFAAEVARKGFKAGVTVDPLAIEGGNDGWTATSQDGTRWLNPASPEARAFGVQRLRGLMAEGFEFCVVAAPAIPDEVLRHFNVTRAQAYSGAFEIAREAAGNKPVLPPAAATLGGNPTEWRDAAASSAQMREYGVTLGPIRVDVEAMGDPAPEWAGLVASYSGPLELIGRPRTSLVRALAQEYPRTVYVTEAQGQTGGAGN